MNRMRKSLKINRGAFCRFKGAKRALVRENLSWGRGPGRDVVSDFMVIRLGELPHQLGNEPAARLGILDFLVAGETTHQHIRTP
jgi:hypothetical protein